MQHSRSESRGSLTNSSANRPLGFRTIHRKRSSHEVIDFPSKSIGEKEASTNSPTQSRLEQLLYLKPTNNQYDDKDPLASNRRNIFSEGNQLLSRSRMGESNLSRKSRQNVSKMLENQKEKEKQAFNFSREQNSSRSMISSLSHRSKIADTQIISRMTRQTEKVDLPAIDEKMNDLVTKKLSLVKEHLSSKQKTDSNAFSLKSAEIDNELQQLLQQIVKIKATHEISSKNDEILNKKIAYIETLLATHMTSVDLMKKRYFGIEATKGKSLRLQANLYKKAIAKTFDSLLLLQKEQRSNKTEMVPVKKTRACIDNVTINKSSFRQPNPEDYETFRFKHKPVQINRQPLPCSSYNRDYRQVRSQPSEKVVIGDNSDVFPRHFYDLFSLYNKQFKKYKSELVNHKQMDACRDKFKFVDVSYIPRKKSESLVKSKEKYCKKQTMEIQLKLPLQRKQPPIKSSETESKFSKKMLISEARREFVWGNTMDKSRIKHKQLNEFQYRLKNLYKA